MEIGPLRSEDIRGAYCNEYVIGGVVGSWCQTPDWWIRGARCQVPVARATEWNKRQSRFRFSLACNVNSSL